MWYVQACINLLKLLIIHMQIEKIEITYLDKSKDK